MKKHLSSIFSIALLFGSINYSNAQTNAALNFDGNDDAVSLGSSLNSVLDPLNTITVEAWVNTSTLTGLGVIVGNYNSDSNNGELQLLLRRDQDQYSFWVNDGAGWQSVYSATGTVALNTWQHVAGTWNGSELNIYVNGILMGNTIGVTGSSFAYTANTLKIGYNAINENFTGSIDEMRIWSAARSLSEIQASMNCTVDQESNGLLAYYAFNDGLANGVNTGTTLNDVTGHGYTGTLVNFALIGTTSNFATDARSNYLSLQSSIGSMSNADRLGNGTAADFNGDGLNDLLVNDDNANTRIYLNNGKGNFSAYSQITTGIGGKSSAGDVDNDGDIDFCIAQGQSFVNVYINNGSATFTPITVTMNGTGTAGVTKLVDVNNDNMLDLIIGNNNFGATDNNEVWLNTGTVGNAAFTFSAALNNNGIGSRTSITVGDVDGDGDKDILTGSYSYPSSLFLNNSNNGTFTQGIMPAGYSSQVELTDWDQDGDLDAMIYDSYNNVGLKISKNDGSGNFGPLSLSILQSSTSNYCYLKDLNGDGFLDAILSNWGGKGKIYLNTGCALVLQTSCEYNLGYSDNGNAVADFNGDGKMDVFCLARNHFSTLYMNYLTPATTPALPAITSAPSVNGCEGTSAMLTAIAAGPETIEWYSTSTGGSSLASGSNYSVTAPVGNYTYYVDAVNSNGCYTAARTIVNLTVNPAPVISASSGDVTVCGDATATFDLVSAGTNTYQWFYANSLAPFDSAMINGGNGELGFNTNTMTIPQLFSNGWNNYFIYAIVTNQFNCSAYSNDALITVNALPVVGVTASATAVCAGTDITLSGTGASTYTWTDGVMDNTSFAPASSHTYTVTGTDVNGCQDMETIAITVNPLPSVITSTSGITVTAAENGAGYQWLDCSTSNSIISGETAQSFTASANGSFAVEVTLGGCIDTSACVTISTVGFNSLTENSEIKIYPNPAKDCINIDCNTNSLISIVNLLGQNLVQIKTNGSSAKIDTSKLSAGVYMLNVKTETAMHTTRIIIE